MFKKNSSIPIHILGRAKKSPPILWTDKINWPQNWSIPEPALSRSQTKLKILSDALYVDYETTEREATEDHNNNNKLCSHTHTHKHQATDIHVYMYAYMLIHIYSRVCWCGGRTSIYDYYYYVSSTRWQMHKTRTHIDGYYYHYYYYYYTYIWTHGGGYRHGSSGNSTSKDRNRDWEWNWLCGGSGKHAHTYHDPVSQCICIGLATFFTYPLSSGSRHSCMTIIPLLEMNTSIAVIWALTDIRWISDQI